MSCCCRVQITATTPPKSPSSPSPLSLTTRHDDPIRLLLLRFFSGCFFSATTVSDAESSRVAEVSKTDTPRGMSGASRSRVGRKSVSDTRPTRTRRQKRRVRASLSIINSTFTTVKGFDSRTVRCYLGRPWKKYSRTAIMESYIRDFMDSAGWMEMDGTEYLDTLVFREYSNRGQVAGFQGYE